MTGILPELMIKVNRCYDGYQTLSAAARFTVNNELVAVVECYGVLKKMYASTFSKMTKINNRIDKNH
jgi:hypothetical protein